MSEVERIISDLRAWACGKKTSGAPLRKSTAKRLLAYVEILESKVRYPFGPVSIPTAAAQPPAPGSCFTLTPGGDPVATLRAGAPEEQKPERRTCQWPQCDPGLKDYCYEDCVETFPRPWLGPDERQGEI